MSVTSGKIRARVDGPDGDGPPAASAASSTPVDFETHPAVTTTLLEPILRDDMRVVDRVLRESLASDVALIRQISEHIVGGGGKRLRPALLLLTARTEAVAAQEVGSVPLELV